MAKEDPQIVRELKAFGMRHIRERLAAADGRFVDKAGAHEAVVAAFKAEYGWPPDATEMERTVGSKLREDLNHEEHEEAQEHTHAHAFTRRVSEITARPIFKRLSFFVFFLVLFVVNCSS